MKKLSLVFFALLLTSCSQSSKQLRDNFLSLNQEEPALSGNGEKLALIVDKNGRPSVQLRELSSGKTLPLRHLSRNQPHSSPSLSWNGRYIAVIGQRGNRRIAIIEDRLTGKFHQLRLPGERIPIRISLAPDARKLAVQIADQGKWKIELYDLTSKFEPDEQPGAIYRTEIDK